MAVMETWHLVERTTLETARWEHASIVGAFVTLNMMHGGGGPERLIPLLAIVNESITLFQCVYPS